MEISQNFVAFSEYINFITYRSCERCPMPILYFNIFPPIYTLNLWVDTWMSVEIFWNLQSFADWWAAHQMVSRNHNPEFRVFMIFLTDEIVMTKKRVHWSNCWRNLKNSWNYLKLFGELFKNRENFSWNP